MDKSIEQAMAICRVAGCEFTQEELDCFEKVSRGEMTLEEMEKKLLLKVSLSDKREKKGKK